MLLVQGFCSVYKKKLRAHRGECLFRNVSEAHECRNNGAPLLST